MAAEKPSTTEVDRLSHLIYEISGQKVLLDADLTSVYGLAKAALNQQRDRVSREEGLRGIWSAVETEEGQWTRKR
jgi:ORF6N domain